MPRAVKAQPTIHWLPSGLSDSKSRHRLEFAQARWVWVLEGTWWDQQLFYYHLGGRRTRRSSQAMAYRVGSFWICDFPFRLVRCEVWSTERNHLTRKEVRRSYRKLIYQVGPAIKAWACRLYNKMVDMGWQIGTIVYKKATVLKVFTATDGRRMINRSWRRSSREPCTVEHERPKICAEIPALIKAEEREERRERRRWVTDQDRYSVGALCFAINRVLVDSSSGVRTNRFHLGY